MDEPWTPTLRLEDVGGKCQLSLAGWATGRGDTLQAAGDNLIENLLALGIKVQATGVVVSSELALDLRLFEFLQDLVQIAADGGDVRGHVFGVATDAALEG